MLEVRSALPELMDDTGLPARDLGRALDELTAINRWLGGHRTSRKGIGKVIANTPGHRPVTLLDIGSGGSGLDAALAPLHRRFAVTALDLNIRAHEYAQRHAQHVAFVIGSAHALPFADGSFDIVHASLFLHHCTDAEARVLLANAVRIARYGVVINDLHRHICAYAGIAALTRVLSKSPVVRNDALVSVRRAFTRKELLRLLPPGGGMQVSLSWRWAFRWCLCITVSPRTNHG